MKTRTKQDSTNLDTMTIRAIIAIAWVMGGASQAKANVAHFEEWSRVATQTRQSKIVINVEVHKVWSHYAWTSKVIQHLQQEGNATEELEEEASRTAAFAGRLAAIEALVIQKTVETGEEHQETIIALNEMMRRAKANETRRRRDAEAPEEGNPLTVIIEDGALRIQDTLEQVEQQKEALRESLSNTTLSDSDLKELVLETLASLERNFTRELNAYLKGLSDLGNHRVNRLLFNEQKVRFAYEELVRDAEKQDLEPIYTGYSQIYEVQADLVMADDQKVYAWIWIPFQKNLKVKMYRYISEPIDWRGFHLHVKPKTDILALDENQHIARELPRTDLERCKVMNGITICPNEQVYHQQIEELCLYNLWRGDGDEARRTCRLELSLRKAQFIPLTSGLVRAHLPDPVDLIHTCGRTTLKAQVGNHDIVRLNKTCPMAVGHDFILLSEDDHLDNQLFTQPLSIGNETDLFDTGADQEAHYQDAWLEEALSENGGALDVPTLKRIHEESHETWEVFIRQTVAEVLTVAMFAYTATRCCHKQHRCTSPYVVVNRRVLERPSRSSSPPTIITPRAPPFALAAPTPPPSP